MSRRKEKQKSSLLKLVGHRQENSLVSVICTKTWRTQGTLIMWMSKCSRQHPHSRAGGTVAIPWGKNTLAFLAGWLRLLSWGQTVGGKERAGREVSLSFTLTAHNAHYKGLEFLFKYILIQWQFTEFISHIREESSCRNDLALKLSIFFYAHIGFKLWIYT